MQRSHCGGHGAGVGSLFPPGYGETGEIGSTRANFPVDLPLGGRFPTCGCLPSTFPPGYDDWLLGLACHPEVLELHRRLIGSSDLRFDHSALLDYPAGSDGRRWHAHPYHQDGWGPTARYEGLGLVRTMIYPHGSSAELGGDLALVPGAHLYREAFCWNAERADDDAAMERGWLHGRTHPRTGAPLAIKHLELPPGSLVCFPAHMPHFVSPRKAGAGTRWGLLLSYREPDPTGRLRSISRRLPDGWVGTLPAPRRALFREF